MIDYDTEFRRLVARERAAALTADWGRRAAPPRGLRTPLRSPSGLRGNSRLPLLLGRHGRHAHRVAAHRG